MSTGDLRKHINLLEEAEPLGYQIEFEDFKNLEGIMTALFGDSTPLTSDRRRDLANHMYVVLKRVRDNPVYE